MRVDVDEPGRDSESPRVDLDRPLLGDASRHRRDPSADDRYVQLRSGGAGAVNDVATANHEVMRRPIREQGGGSADEARCGASGRGQEVATGCQGCLSVKDTSKVISGDTLPRAPRFPSRLVAAARGQRPPASGP